MIGCQERRNLEMTVIGRPAEFVVLNTTFAMSPSDILIQSPNVTTPAPESRIAPRLKSYLNNVLRSVSESYRVLTLSVYSKIFFET